MVYMRKIERRAAIIDAAADLVWNVGLEAVTVRGVAAHLGWSQGHVHHQFDSLDDLRAEAFTSVWKRLAPTYEPDASRPFPDQVISVLIGDTAEDVAPIADRIWRDALTAARMHPTVKAVLQSAMQEWVTGVVAVLEAGRRSGDIPAELEADDLARRLISYAIGQDIVADVLDGDNPVEGQAVLLRKALVIECAAANSSRGGVAAEPVSA